MNLYVSKDFFVTDDSRTKKRNREAHELWQKHHFIVKELMRKINEKSEYILRL